MVEDPIKKKKKKGYKAAKKIFKYFLIHKPYNVLSQFSQSEQTTTTTKKETKEPIKTLKSYFPLYKDVYPIGRLDSDSEGLLLLTNNVKGITQKLLHPQQKHPRTYLAQVEGIPTPEALKKLREGVDLKEYTSLPAQVELLTEEPKVSERNPPIRARKNSPTSWLKLVLIEGKNRQVRRMTAAVGFPTLRLIRINFAGLELGDLAPGKHRPLTNDEILHLENVCKLQKGRRNTKVTVKRELTKHEQAQLQRQRELSQQGREKKRRKETWWVELQKHYMTAQDHQDALFDQAKIAEERERVAKVMEIDDIVSGRKKPPKLPDIEEEQEDENLKVELPKKPKRGNVKQKKTSDIKS